MGIKDSVLSGFDPNETKREFLERLFPKMQNTDNGKKVILQMALELAEFNDFPDLKGFEDSNLKIKNANDAVSKLKQCLLNQKKRMMMRKKK